MLRAIRQGEDERTDICARLLTSGQIDEAAAARARRAQERTGERIDLVLTRLGLVPESVLAAMLAEHLGLPVATAAAMPAEPLFADELKRAFLETHRILPLAADAARISLAMADPYNDEAAAAVAFLLRRRVDRQVAASADIDAALARLYGEADPTPSAAITVDDGVSDDDVTRLEDIASEAPIIRAVNGLIARAVEAGASDIHVEPFESGVRVRQRVDGVLATTDTLPTAMRAAVTSRIKLMARLNIAERRLPQDGRIRTTIRGRDLDLRVSTMPTLHGESVVLRILDRASLALDLGTLGFADRVRAELEHALAATNGIVLVTGPTGSGKTTTLYAALSQLNTTESKILTVEDPVEYHLAGINQIQVHPQIGLTFASALRSILRQDPDIIMVGEIRDLETAEIAVQASLTGHLVLSTVHTNSAAATINRLLDMGVEPFLLASSLKAILAQRLVRRLCAACSVPAEVPAAVLERMWRASLPPRQAEGGRDLAPLFADAKPRQAVGCEACRGTGYAGRVPIMELLTIDAGARSLILAGASEDRIFEAAHAAGMGSMLRDGLGKVIAGETTIEEVHQAVRSVG